MTDQGSGSALGESGSRDPWRPEVLFLIHDLRHGGAERCFVNLVNHLRGVLPVPVLMRRVGGLESALHPDRPSFDLSSPAYATAVGTHPAGSPAGWRRKIPGGWRVATLVQRAHRLQRLATLHNARTISAFLHKSHILALVTKLLFDRRLRVVLNVHSIASEMLTHLAPDRPEHRYLGWFMRTCYPLADRIVAVSGEVKQDLVDRFGITPDRIVVVPTALDVEDIRRHAGVPSPRLPRDWQRPLVVAVGRLVPLKGFDLLIQAFARLPLPLRGGLVIVGDGPERERLGRLADELGLAAAVHLVGALDRPWATMALADVLVLPSRSDAWPSVLGESLVLGVPVIAAACSAGVRAYLGEGSCGMLVPPGDADALAGAMVRMLTSAELRQALVDRGQKHAQVFDVSRSVAAYELALSAAANPSPST